MLFEENVHFKSVSVKSFNPCLLQQHFESNCDNSSAG